MKVKELLSDESKWTQGVSARTESGIPTSYHGQETAKWCLLGALAKCYGVNTDDWDSIRARIRIRLSPDGLFPVDWNDAPNRTFSEVKALVEELDI